MHFISLSVGESAFFSVIENADCIKICALLSGIRKTVFPFLGEKGEVLILLKAHELSTLSFVSESQAMSFETKLEKELRALLSV